MAIVRPGYVASGPAGISAVLSLLAPELLDAVVVAAPCRGTEAVVALCDEPQQQFEELHVVPDEFVTPDADRVLVLGMHRACALRSFEDMCTAIVRRTHGIVTSRAA